MIDKNDYIQALKFDWESIDFDNTDQGKKISVPPLFKEYNHNGKIVELPSIGKVKTETVDVSVAIRNRKSNRKYSDEKLTIEDLSYLLNLTQGIKEIKTKYTLRNLPSAGSRHSFETYLVVNRVGEFEKGLYRYLPQKNALIQEYVFIKNEIEVFNEAVLGQLFNSAVYFIWTAIPYRMEWRYSFASAKLLAIDIGHVCQNLYLACESIKCGICAIGAYNQTQVDKFIGVNGENEFAIYLASVGKL